VDVGEGGEASGPTPIAFSPPIFVRPVSVSVFHVIPPSYFTIIEGGSLYRCF
jgi:hypothetical protein